jgi:hypothetical protein
MSPEKMLQKLKITVISPRHRRQNIQLAFHKWGGEIRSRENQHDAPVPGPAGIICTKFHQESDRVSHSYFGHLIFLNGFLTFIPAAIEILEQLATVA